MLTLQEKEEFNVLVNDINKNLIKPYRNAASEVNNMDFRIHFLKSEIQELYNLIQDINDLLLECESVYARLVKRS